MCVCFVSFFSAQVHKVRRKLYLYDIDDITTSHSVDDSDMDGRARPTDLG